MATQKWKVNNEKESTDNESVSTDIDFTESFDLAMFDALANEPAKPARRRRVEPVAEETREEENLSSRLTRRSRFTAERSENWPTSTSNRELTSSGPNEASPSTFARSTMSRPLKETTFSLSGSNSPLEPVTKVDTTPQPTSFFSKTESVSRSPQEIHPIRMFCQTVLFICITILAGWAIYGVSVQSNLGFWRETFQKEISYIARSLPVMMIDQH